MDSGDAQPLSFEDAFRQLAEIAEGMERGGLTLAEATARFEQGMKLVQHCNRLLDTAELELTELRENYQRSDPAAGPHNNGTPPAYDPPEYDDDDTEYLPF